MAPDETQLWFIHIQGQTLGPLPTETIVLMLNQNRLQFADFAWTTGFINWTRLYEIDTFKNALPNAPQIPIPSNAEELVLLLQSPREYHFVDRTPGEDSVMHPESVGREFPRVRLGLRVPIAGRVLVKNHGPFKIVDISEGGVFVMAPAPIAVGTPIEFTLEANALSHPLHFTGTVTRHNRPGESSGFAIQFTNTPPQTMYVLQSYIRSKG